MALWIAPDPVALDRLASLQPELAIAAAQPVLDRLARHPRLLHHLPDAKTGAPASTTIHLGANLSLQLFLWPSGAWTPIHDHTSWGVYLCLDGGLIEDRYTRLDDSMQPDIAHVRREWRCLWQPGQKSSLLPYADGIHRVGNPSQRPAVSLHLYGPRMAEMDGRDYDPRRDFVCDRPAEVLTPERELLAA